MSVPPDYDHLAGWDEVLAFVQGVVDGAGKARAGQEARVGAMRARREYVVESIDAADTGLQRRTPSTEWGWTIVLAFKYPGRGAAGHIRDALADLEPVAAALETSNPKRGWRVHVARLQGRAQGNDFVLRLQVQVERVYWRTGAVVGQSSDGAEAEQQALS